MTTETMHTRRMIAIRVDLPQTEDEQTIHRGRCCTWGDVLRDAYNAVTSGYPSLNGTWGLLCGMNAGDLEINVAQQVWGFEHPGEDGEGWGPQFGKYVNMQTEEVEYNLINCVTSNNDRLSVMLDNASPPRWFEARWQTSTNTHLRKLLTEDGDWTETFYDLNIAVEIED